MNETVKIDKIRHYGLPLNESTIEKLMEVTGCEERKAALETAVRYTIDTYKLRHVKKLKEFKSEEKKHE